MLLPQNPPLGILLEQECFMNTPAWSTHPPGDCVLEQELSLFQSSQNLVSLSCLVFLGAGEASVFPPPLLLVWALAGITCIFFSSFCTAVLSEAESREGGLMWVLHKTRISWNVIGMACLCALTPLECMNFSKKRTYWATVGEPLQCFSITTFRRAVEDQSRVCMWRQIAE